MNIHLAIIGLAILHIGISFNPNFQQPLRTMFLSIGGFLLGVGTYLMFQLI